MPPSGLTEEEYRRRQRRQMSGADIPPAVAPYGPARFGMQRNGLAWVGPPTPAPAPAPGTTNPPSMFGNSPVPPGPGSTVPLPPGSYPIGTVPPGLAPQPGTGGIPPMPTPPPGTPQQPTIPTPDNPSGGDWFYNPGEFWDTLAGFTPNEGDFEGPGWYGPGGMQYGGLGNFGNEENPYAVYYGGEHYGEGGTGPGGSYSNVRSGRRNGGQNWREVQREYNPTQAQIDEMARRVRTANLNAARRQLPSWNAIRRQGQLDFMRRMQGIRRALNTNPTNPNPPSTPSWMGQLVSFNP